MARIETVLRVFVASPDDMTEERELLESVVRELNNTWSEKLGIRLDLVRWETHAYPSVGLDAQTVINDQIGDDYDIFVGMMWKRFGTPTGRAGSGTEEEFERAYQRFREKPNELRIMFYFKDYPVKPSEMDLEQLTLIKEFREKLGAKGTLYWTYTNPEEFPSLLRMHLSKQVQEWQKSWGTGAARETSSLESVADVIQVEKAEEGLIDLIEKGQESFENSYQVALRILVTTNELGETIKKRTEEINSMRTSRVRVDIKALKRIVERVAEDMEQFVARMEPELSIFSQSYSKGVNALTRVASLSSDFKSEDKKEVVDTLEMVKTLKDELYEVLSGLSTFQAEVKNIPPISTKLNQAKKHTLSVLKDFADRMTAAINLTAEVEITIQGLLSNFQAS